MGAAHSVARIRLAGKVTPWFGKTRMFGLRIMK